jgi:DNA-binding MarR family transcriptional regulator
MNMDNKSRKNLLSAEDLTRLPTYRAGVAQSTAYRIIMKLTDDSVREYGITAMQWFLIGHIFDAGQKGITVTQLSKLLDTNLPYITNTLNLLASKNIIVRTLGQQDTRQKTVTIDPGFVHNIEEIEHVLRNKLQKVLYTDITPQELLTYIKVLYKINSAVN